MKNRPVVVLIAVFLVLDVGAAISFFGDHIKAAFGTSCTLLPGSNNWNKRSSARSEAPRVPGASSAIPLAWSVHRVSPPSRP